MSINGSPVDVNRTERAGEHYPLQALGTNEDSDGIESMGQPEKAAVVR